MTKHMIGLLRASTLLLAVALSVAAAAGAPGGAHRQVTAASEVPRLVFVGDTRNGAVKVFRLVPHPVHVATLDAADRVAVLGIKVDAALRRVWVLGRHGAYAYDLDGLRILRVLRVPMGVTLSAMELTSDGALQLLTANGSVWRAGPGLAALQPVGRQRNDDGAAYRGG